MKNSAIKQLKKTKSNNKPGRGILGKKSKVSAKQLIEFTRNLAVMLNAKLPLVNSLEIIRSQTQDLNFKKVIKGLIKKVEKGNTLSAGLKHYPDVFDEHFVQMANVGESAGILGEVLKRHAEYMDKTSRLKKKIGLSLVYPGIIIGTAIMAVTFLLLFIIPTFSEVFTDMGSQLPKPTAMLLAISANIPLYSVILLFIFVALFYLVKQLLRNENIKYNLDKYILKIPLFGELLLKAFVARFCRTLGVLLESGFPLTNSLAITLKIVNNTYLRKKIKIVSKDVKKGINFSQSIRKAGVFPEMISQLAAVGESTASLDETLLYVAEEYEKDIDTIIETVTTVLEPVMIIVLGIVIAGLLVALYLPMFDVVEGIKY